MLRVELGDKSSRYCDGLSRRSFLQLGVAGMATAGLGRILRAKEAAAASGLARKNTADPVTWTCTI
jgi:hypothetical protein